MTPYQFLELTDTAGNVRIVNLAQIKYICKAPDGNIFVSFGDNATMYLTPDEAQTLFDEIGFYL